MQQTPKVVILGCSDSRVPHEIIFDQGLGDIFAIRVAGHVFGGPVCGSVEYAVNVLKVKLVVVLGHEGCGAVRSAMSSNGQSHGDMPELDELLLEVKKALDKNRAIHFINDKRARDREAVVTNVLAQMRRIHDCQAVSQRVLQGQLLVVGAFYEISSGMVSSTHSMCRTLSRSPRF